MVAHDIRSRVLRELHGLVDRMNHSANLKPALELQEKLYYAASQEGKHMQRIFPDVAPSSLPQSWTETSHRERERRYLLQKKESVSHTGRNCGRKFGLGEPIYRCVDCGFDETCVLCVHCFNKDDHVGHQVSTTVSTERNTGICDCGDPEAWTVEIHCKCDAHPANGASQDDPVVYDQKYERYLKELFDVCIEYIIEVFAHQNQTVRPIQAKLSNYASDGQRDELLSLLYDEIQKREDAMAEFFGFKPKDVPNKFALVFWNDEFHNFTEAQNAIGDAGDFTREEAKELAKKIDQHGRAILSRKSTVMEMVPNLSIRSRKGFDASVMTISEYNRQELANNIIQWMCKVTKHPVKGFQRIVRSAFCQSICGEYKIPETRVPFWNSRDRHLPEYSGLLHGTDLPVDYLPSECYKDSKLPIATSHTRLKYLLFFEPRFYKSMRTNLHDAIVPTLVADLKYKAIGCDQIVEIYGLLLRNIYDFDRESHRTILDEISVQFFTCPTNCTTIVANSLERILIPAKYILERMCNPNRKIHLALRKYDDPTLGKYTAHTRIIGDLHTILEKVADTSPLFEAPNIHNFLEILSFHDNCYPIQRQVGEHVANEDTKFMVYESPVARVTDIVMAATDPEKLEKADIKLFEKAISTLCENLGDSYSTMAPHKYRDMNLVGFTVSEEKVCFFHPSHTMLANILRTKVFTNVESIQYFLDRAGDYMVVSDGALRSIVLASQIESRHWIRNGTGILSLAASYMDHGFFDVEDTPFRNDIYLLQVAFLTLDPALVLLNAIDRFELMEWFSGSVNLLCTFYEKKVTTIVEKLLSFLYAILTERTDFMNFQTPEERYLFRMKELVTYILFLKPKTYSEIEEEVEHETLSDPSFQKALNEVSVYTPPRGLNDDGKYSLKKSEYKNVDPLKLAAQDVDFVDSVGVISKHLTVAGKSADDCVITPNVASLDRFNTLGDFTRTQPFARLICKLLDHAVAEVDETNVAMVLHLLHASIIDDELVNGSSHFIDAYIQVPLCEALFKISHLTKFSKSNVTKADFILETLILKDRELVFETLVSCYGSATVEEYKESKKSTGVDFDETENERKRRLAKERQKKLLEKMQKKQKAFIQKNDTETTRHVETDEDKDSDSKVCVLCQGHESKDAMIAMPMTIGESDVFRSCRLDETDALSRSFLDWEQDSIENTLGNYGKALSAKGSLTKPKTLSSCNHGIHHKCLRDHMQRNNLTTLSFACPLCETKNDTYLPSLIKKKNFSDEDLNTCESGNNMSNHFMKECHELYNPRGIQEMDSCLHTVLGSPYQPDLVFYEIMKDTRRQFSLSLAQAELATRINGASSYTEFLKQIPEQTYRALRSYFEYYLIVDMERAATPEAELARDTKLLLDQGLLIEVFFLIYMENNYGFKKMSQSVIKFFSERHLYSVLNAVNSIPGDELPPSEDIAPSLVESFRELLNIRGDKMSLSALLRSKFLTNDEFAKTVITMTLQLLLVSIRPLAVFYKVLVPSFEIANIEIGDDTLSRTELVLSSLSLGSLNSTLTEDSHNILFARSGNIFGTYLPLPGVTKLVDLPEELSYFTTMSNTDPSRFPMPSNVKNGHNRIDFKVCLVCGHKLFDKANMQDVHEHLKDGSPCKSRGGALFLIPRRDMVLLVSYKENRYYSGHINAPYLNIHGQSGPKAAQSGLVAKLNYDRYKYLNSLWLTGGIYPYLTRTSKVPRSLNDGGIEDFLWNQLLRQQNGNAAATGIEQMNAMLDIIRNQVPANFRPQDIFEILGGEGGGIRDDPDLFGDDEEDGDDDFGSEDMMDDFDEDEEDELDDDGFDYEDEFDPGLGYFAAGDDEDEEDDDDYVTGPSGAEDDGEGWTDDDVDMSDGVGSLEVAVEAAVYDRFIAAMTGAPHNVQDHDPLDYASDDVD